MLVYVTEMTDAVEELMSSQVKLFLLYELYSIIFMV